MIKKFMFVVALVVATVSLSVATFANEDYPVLLSYPITIGDIEQNKPDEPLLEEDYTDSQEYSF